MAADLPLRLEGQAAVQAALAAQFACDQAAVDAAEPGLAACPAIAARAGAPV